MQGFCDTKTCLKRGGGTFDGTFDDSAHLHRSMRKGTNFFGGRSCYPSTWELGMYHDVSKDIDLPSKDCFNHPIQVKHFAASWMYNDVYKRVSWVNIPPRSPTWFWMMESASSPVGSTTTRQFSIMRIIHSSFLLLVVMHLLLVAMHLLLVAI